MSWPKWYLALSKRARATLTDWFKLTRHVWSTEYHSLSIHHILSHQTSQASRRKQKEFHFKIEMDRGRKALPVQNKACNQRYIKRCQERHRQKVSKWNFSSLIPVHPFSHSFQLRDMKCSIDNKPPRSATHLKTKAKKNALMEDRIDQIETENRILLQKMTHIMRVSSLVWWVNHSWCLHSHLTHEFIVCNLF